MPWKITPLYFLSQTFILWTKKAHDNDGDDDDDDDDDDELLLSCG